MRLVCVLTGATATRAQDKFPSRTIRIIVPFAPGGGVDTLARLLAERMQPKMGVNVIVENRAGANGTIGGSHVLQSPPDGYTVLFSSNTHTMSKLVMSNAPYDPLADFTPIARGGEAPLLVVISPKLPQNTLAEVRGRRAEGAGQVDCRHAGARLAGPHRDLELQPPVQDQYDDHALSRHGARTNRRRGRTYPDADRRHRGAAADGQERRRQGACRHHDQAQRHRRRISRLRRRAACPD